MRTLVPMSQLLHPSQIRVLPEQLANQIAAGEVVERPASVIKELIENSLDAGANQIDIDIEEGGLKKIIVRDNGSGIAQEQLALAICRHATSKIESVEDLEAIDSLGFRGEALASIGSVSRLKLISRIKDEDHAWCLSSRNGVDLQIEPIAHPAGTSLEVCDLFYNTPARRKFLRTDRTEFRHIDEIFRRMALAQFEVGFQLKHNHRSVYQLPAAVDREQRQKRLHKLFGKAFVQQSMYVDLQASGLRLWGWLSQPDYSRSQADQQYFYVNGRIIRDRIINHAIRLAYQPRLYPGRQAAYVLHLELNESLVDVNVHPTKHEVRFRESRLVHDFIHKVVGDALSQKTSPRLDVGEDHKTYREPTYVSIPQQMSSQVREEVNPYRVLTDAPPLKQEVTPLGVFLYDMQNRFWLFAQDKGLVLLDLRSAREQVFYQHLSYAEVPLQQQPILVPLNLKFTSAQIQLLEKHLEKFQNWGFDLRLTGPQTAMVLHVPILLRGVDIENLLNGLILQWQETRPDTKEQMSKDLAKLAAIHFRRDAKIENRNVWLEEVLALPESVVPPWRLITMEHVTELLQHG